MSARNYVYPLRFGTAAEATLTANTAATVLTLPSDPPYEGVRVIGTAAFRVAVGRTAVATDPLVAANQEIYLAARSGDIVSAISTGTPTVSAVPYTK